MLAGGGRNTIGRVPEVVGIALVDDAIRAELAGLLESDDPVVRLRAADALEKVARSRPGLLQPFKDMLLSLAETETQMEVRWHLAQMLPRLDLGKAERERALTALDAYRDDPSAIVQAWTLTAIVELCCQGGRQNDLAARLIEEALMSPRASLRARARALQKGRHSEARGRRNG